MKLCTCKLHFCNCQIGLHVFTVGKVSVIDRSGLIDPSAAQPFAIWLLDHWLNCAIIRATTNNTGIDDENFRIFCRASCDV